MDYFLAFIGLLWLTFRIGKEDGKWDALPSSS